MLKPRNLTQLSISLSLSKPCCVSSILPCARCALTPADSHAPAGSTSPGDTALLPSCHGHSLAAVTARLEKKAKKKNQNQHHLNSQKGVSVQPPRMHCCYSSFTQSPENKLSFPHNAQEMDNHTPPRRHGLMPSTHLPRTELQRQHLQNRCWTY